MRVVAWGVVAALTGAVPAAAANVAVDDVVAGLEGDRVHVTAAAEVDEGAIAEALADDPGVAVVFTGAAPSDGEQGLADRVVLALQDPVHTVLVRSREGVAAASTRFSDRQLDDAVDDSFDALRESPIRGVERFADALPANAGGSRDDDRDSGGIPGGLLVFGLVVAVVIVVQVVRRATGRGGSSWSSGDSGGGATGWGSRRTSRFRSSSSRSSGFRSSGSRSSGRSRSISGRSSRRF